MILEEIISKIAAPFYYRSTNPVHESIIKSVIEPYVKSNPSKIKHIKSGNIPKDLYKSLEEAVGRIPNPHNVPKEMIIKDVVSHYRPREVAPISKFAEIFKVRRWLR